MDIAGNEYADMAAKEAARKPPWRQGDNAGFKSDDISICVLFRFQNPLARDVILAGWIFDEFPSSILHQRVIFLLDRKLPLFAIDGIIYGFLIALRFDGKRHLSFESDVRLSL